MNKEIKVKRDFTNIQEVLFENGEIEGLVECEEYLRKNKVIDNGTGLEIKNCRERLMKNDRVEIIKPLKLGKSFITVDINSKEELKMANIKDLLGKEVLNNHHLDVEELTDSELSIETNVFPKSETIGLETYYKVRFHDEDDENNLERKIILAIRHYSSGNYRVVMVRENGTETWLSYIGIFDRIISEHDYMDDEFKELMNDRLDRLDNEMIDVSQMDYNLRDIIESYNDYKKIDPTVWDKKYEFIDELKEKLD